MSFARIIGARTTGSWLRAVGVTAMAASGAMAQQPQKPTIPVIMADDVGQQSKTRDSDDKPLIFAAAQSSKQKQANACRARHRDCVKLNQIPSFECQYIYQDCISHIY